MDDPHEPARTEEGVHDKHVRPLAMRIWVQRHPENNRAKQNFNESKMILHCEPMCRSVFHTSFNLFNLSFPSLKFIKATGHEALLQRGVDEGKADAPILFGLYVNPTTARAIHCRTGNCSHPTSLEPSTPISAALTFRMNGFRSHVVLKSVIRPFLQLAGVG